MIPSSTGMLQSMENRRVTFLRVGFFRTGLRPTRFGFSFPFPLRNLPLASFFAARPGLRSFFEAVLGFSCFGFGLVGGLVSRELFPAEILVVGAFVSPSDLCFFVFWESLVSGAALFEDSFGALETG